MCIRDSYYFVRHGVLAGVRVGRWKLLRDVEGGPWSNEGTALYDLEADRGETENSAEQHPEVVRALEKRMEAFLREFRQQMREPGKV